MSNLGFDAKKRPLLQQRSLYKLSHVQDCDMKLMKKIDEIHKYSPSAVFAITNKSLIVSGGDDKMIKVHSGQDLSMVASVPSAHENGCCSLMEATDDLFCSGGFEGEIHVSDIGKITGKTEGIVSTFESKFYKPRNIECQRPYNCIWDSKMYSSHKDPHCYEPFSVIDNSDLH